MLFEAIPFHHCHRAVAVVVAVAVAIVVVVVVSVSECCGVDVLRLKFIHEQ